MQYIQIQCYQFAIVCISQILNVWHILNVFHILDSVNR